MSNRVVHSRLAISLTAAAVGTASLAVAGHAEAVALRQNGRIGYIDSVNGGWITANPDGSDRRAVTLSGPGLPANAKALALKYSPDGTKAVVSVGNLTGNYWLVDAAGHVIRSTAAATFIAS